MSKNISKKKFLLIGDTGYIGQNLKLYLNDYVPYSLSNGNDILDKENLKKKMKDCNIVIHLAGKTSPTESIEKPDEYMRTNLEGTKNVVDIANELNIEQLLFTSTYAIYTDPKNPYVKSKLKAESYLLRNSTVPSDILRLFHVYGKNYKRNTVVKSFIEKIKNNQDIIIEGTGKDRIDFVYIDDVCRCIMSCVSDNNYALPLDVGTGFNYSIQELAYIIMGLVGNTVQIKYTKGRGEIKMSKANPNYSYKCEVDLIDGLKTLL